MVLIPKGSGKWEFQAEVGRDPLTGKRRRISRTFVGSRRQAEREHAVFLRDAETHLPGAKATLGQLLDRWLESKDDLSPTTRQEYQRLIEQRIRPALGAKPLKDLTAGDLDEFYRALQKGGK